MLTPEGNFMAIVLLYYQYKVPSTHVVDAKISMIVGKQSGGYNPYIWFTYNYMQLAVNNMHAVNSQQHE